MRRLVALAVTAGALFLGYRSLASWRAVTVYERFARAWAHGEREEASSYADADIVSNALEKQSLRGMRSGAVMEAFRGERYSIESKTRLPGGDLGLEARQTIFFDPPGATTAMGGAMFTNIHHSVTLHGGPLNWKVVRFQAAFVDMGETRARRP